MRTTRPAACRGISTIQKARKVWNELGGIDCPNHCGRVLLDIGPYGSSHWGRYTVGEELMAAGTRVPGMTARGSVPTELTLRFMQGFSYTPFAGRPADPPQRKCYVPK